MCVVICFKSKQNSIKMHLFYMQPF